MNAPGSLLVFSSLLNVIASASSKSSESGPWQEKINDVIIDSVLKKKFLHIYYQ